MSPNQQIKNTEENLITKTKTETRILYYSANSAAYPLWDWK